MLYLSQADEDEMVTVVYELNGGIRTVRVKDNKIKSTRLQHLKVTNPSNEVGAPLQGSLSSVLVKAGDEVKAGQPLFTIEAMKMESTVSAAHDATIKEIILQPGTLVDQNDIIITYN